MELQDRLLSIFAASIRNGYQSYLIMSRSEVPQNLSVVHHVGSKSFVQILKNHKAQIFWAEGLPGQQLSETIMKTAYQTALGLARINPGNTYQYARYDIEGTAETESNRPFREGAMTKLINMFGDIFHSEIGGHHD